MIVNETNTIKKNNELTFFLNGEKKVIKDPNPELTTLQYIRSIGLTGSKLGCGEGGCGACTVMISHRNDSDGRIVHRAVNSCLYPLCQLDGMALVTIEGLGNVRDGLHPVQERIAEGYGSQCGFCTPGIIMALYAYLRSNPNANQKEIEHNFDGNLCRCTGYRPILDAAKSFAIDKTTDEQDEDGDVKIPTIAKIEDDDTKTDSEPGICPSSGKPCNCKQKTSHIPSKPLELKSEPIFPPFLMDYKKESLVFQGDRVTWHTPTSLNEILTIKKTHSNAKIVVGNTEIGIETKFRNVVYPTIISPVRVPELNSIQKQQDGILVGSSVTLTELKSFLLGEIKSDGASDDQKTKVGTFKAIVSQLKWFAGNQIRNAASIGGNLVTASPISDLNPVLLAAGAILTMVSQDESGTIVERKVPIGSFFLKYRIVDIKPEEILQSVFIPYTRPLEFVQAYKQSRRREDDIAIVSCCFRILFENFENNQFKVRECVLAYGGMNVKAVTCQNTEQFLIGSIWDRNQLDEIYKKLEVDLPLAQGAPGGMIEYRRSLTTSFFFKYFLTVSKQLYEISKNPSYSLSDKELSVTAPYSRPLSKGQQEYQTQPEKHPITQPVIHQSADKQVTGEALYVDDIKIKSLYTCFVQSTKAHAKILSIDASRALKAPGVKAFYSAKDVPGENNCGPVIKDDEVFASDIAIFHGAPIGCIVAETHQQALEASKMVQIEYEELPAIVTIEDAIAKKSFFPFTHVIKDGDIVKGFEESDHIIEGEFKCGAQEHFYLEPNGSLVVPGEGKEMTIYASTQNPTKTQGIVASVLGVPQNQVVCKLKRLGGGFGGKETRSIFSTCVAAVAAYHQREPVRIILDRDTDMATTGTRHPFIAKYKVGVTKDGLIKALDLELYADAGYSYDISVGVLDRAIFHSENAYKIPNVNVVGRLCKTNLPSNTAFRGYGGPQAMIIVENWVEKISKVLNIESHIIRAKNFYKEGELTHYLQAVENNQMQRVWDTILEKSNYLERINKVNDFNEKNRWKKRGIAVIPTKFGMSFTVKTLNQAGALVHCYTDGTVLVTHGGTEMGQGLNTKMIQIAARAFGIPVKDVFISETSTDKVANTTPTAASVSSDLNGMAVLDACQNILKRLEPLKEKNPNMTFKQLCIEAFVQRVNLSSNGFYATPNVGYVFKDGGVGEGTPFNYFNFGAACSEVEIDVLTGDHTVLRSDVILDVGDSLNPTIDIGQVEGAFVQGMGWSCTEEVVTFPTGYLFTRGPSTYKIPGFNDVPLEFNVSLLNDAPNPKAIHSSKGVGEPPLFLGSSVYFAIRQAITAARKETNLNDWFDLPSPATCERIRTSCLDSFIYQFTNNKN
ncbi:hypothetical protein DICPUDRAFT_96745 [Dictyostelium purpureum]|uniref:xanthine dehydrogenase n=1 Tax=Dictyostelium purpureum TaxID=5786 RepID=F0ZAV7_DICPU|nr:uncharacterized protein DICPUDRAFT_96745 [Dictyostelium purpureum]EGC38870.1 hypothetical protein DICPUDRAFT_96745 [Dictyostelium purpureum]|eukprot:XP_003284550.1 hypothetical protein DICPUDRAFT_96745 [Dictyostelium purpureum]